MAIGPVGLGIWFLEVVLRFLLLEAEDPLLRLAIVAKPARVVVGCAQRWVTVGRGVEEVVALDGDGDGLGVVVAVV